MGFAERELFPERSTRDLYGAEIRRHRELADMTLTQLANILKFSKAHLSRIECAESPPPPGLSEQLDLVFGTDGVFTRLYPLAKKEPFPDRYRRFMALAAQAVARESFTMTVHGLLQTPAYAEAVLRSGEPFARADEISQRIAARMKLQETLYAEAPANYWFIMDESALCRPIGGPLAMQDQLELILRAAQEPHVTVQILPFSAAEHSELGGALTLLTLPTSTVIAYEEGSRWGNLIEDADLVTRLAAHYDLLRAQALSPRESAEVIRDALEGYRHAARHAPRPVEEE